MCACLPHGQCRGGQLAGLSEELLEGPVVWWEKSLGALFPGHSDGEENSPLSACQVRFMLHAQAAVRTSLDWHVQLADPAYQRGEKLLASCICLCLINLLCANFKVQNLLLLRGKQGGLHIAGLVELFQGNKALFAPNLGSFCLGVVSLQFCCQRCSTTWFLIMNF